MLSQPLNILLLIVVSLAGYWLIYDGLARIGAIQRPDDYKMTAEDLHSLTQLLRGGLR
jgi:hypothetical protein